MKIEFSRQIFEKNVKIQNFMKIRPVLAELFRTDRQTVVPRGRTERHDEANSRFSQCCETRLENAMLFQKAGSTG